jgi:quinoprotein glucose dehydrogenase
MRTCLLLLLAAAAAAQTEWPHYGNDPGGMRYSPLTQIDRANVARLKVAWTYRTKALAPESRLNEKAAFEATPIMVEGTLYFSTPFNQVIALDAETGAERWIFDPQVDRSKSYSEVTSRGVSTWIDTKAGAGSPCRRRIFAGTIDARLIALDAATGQPCADFGAKGTVDLTPGIALKDAGDYQVTSAPAIIKDLVVVGSSIGDNRRHDVEKGTVRAYNARNGKLEWTWDPIPAEVAAGAANAWSTISTDATRNLVFVPTGSASPDFYGARRRGKNEWANSVVALDASSGKPVWAFQVVHHDLWDYDVAAQPVLALVHRNGQEQPVVAVNTKMGHLFVLHRETGRPVFPVEERAVPKSDVPGEESWPTQPFPTTPPLNPTSLRITDAWGLTEADREWCRERLRESRAEGIFTPPSVQGSILFPGNVGGVNWGGAAFDPGRGLLVAATNRVATLLRLIPREEFDTRLKEARAPGSRLRGEFARQSGTAFGMYRELFRSPGGLPCNAPPWGALTAVDLETGRKRWEVPLGKTPVPGGEPIPGALHLGGPLLTAGGLVFIAATVAEETLRAFDVESGKALWEAPLPASAQATPMTYRARRDGKQMVVIAAGGHGKARNKQGDYVIAYTLP